MSFYIFGVGCIITFILLILQTVSAGEWEQVPLRSASQSMSHLSGGEGMQMVFGITFAPNNPRIVYMVTDTSQVWKSIDNGRSWVMKKKGFFANGGISLAVDPLNENIVIVAGSHGEATDSVSSADGIYLSIDGGEKWSLVRQTPFYRGKEGGHFVFHGADSKLKRSEKIYAGTHKNGLLRSLDGGGSWSQVGFVGKKIFDLKKWSDSPLILLVATDAGLFFWDERNRSEQIIPSRGLPRDVSPITSVAVVSSASKSIYLAARKHGVYRSDDGGSMFYPIRKGLPLGVDYNQIAGCFDGAHTALYVSADKYSGLNPFWSSDAGATWHPPTTLDVTNVSLTKKKYFSSYIAIHPLNCCIALTSANGYDRVLRTDDAGRQWEYSSSGFTGGRAGVGRSSFAFGDDANTLVLFLIDFGPALSTDGGKSFALLDVPRRVTTSTPVGMLSGKTIITAVGGWSKQALIVSRDGGLSWKIVLNSEDNYRFMAFHPQEKNVVYAQGLRSLDGGTSWQKLAYGIRAVYSNDGDIVYAVSARDASSASILISRDKGDQWSDPFPPLPVVAKSINEIAVSPHDASALYVATNEGLFVLNSGVWSTPSDKSGLTRDYFGLTAVKAVVVDPFNPNVIYVGRWALGKGQSNGIFRSTDYGKTWSNISYNLGPEFTAWSLAVSPYTGVLYVGSSNGTWRLKAVR